MRNKGKLILVIFVLGMIFAFSPTNEGFIETRDESNFKNVKISDHWTLNFIHVDGNWTHTVGNYSWCSGDGSWINPYTIENVTIDASSSPTGSGIYIENSQNSYFVLRNCTIFGASGLYAGGIKLENTNNGTLIDNNCPNNVHCIYLFNNCINNTISGNIVNNGGNGIALFNNCNNNNITRNNVNNNYAHGIFLDLSCNKNTISKNAANDNLNGIFLGRSCDDNIITRNTASNIATQNQERGILLDNNCDNNTISGNIANNNLDQGIFLNFGCVNNTLSGNSLNNNLKYGLYLLNNCDDNIISGNIASNIDTLNQTKGIFINNGCDKNTISGNTANNNLNQGIHLVINCYNNTISANIIYENDVGIRLEVDSSENIIFFNYIFNNSNTNAFDLALNNWDDGETGNYWGNYSGIDADHDGIGDTPYDIAGGAENQDNKPLMIYRALFFNQPNDLIYEVGEVGHYFKWIVINPTYLRLNFNIFRDGTSIQTGQVFPLRINEIVINVDGLNPGIYGFTIEVSDGSGGTFTDGAWVTVITESNPDLLYLEIIDQLFAFEEFTVIFSICNKDGQGIDSTTIQAWWNGVDVSVDVQNLGSGINIISLDPITVAPWEDPILLNMTISASGYENKYFETYIAVDPDSLYGKDYYPPITPPELILTIILISAGSVGGLVGLILYLTKRKKSVI